MKDKFFKFCPDCGVKQVYKGKKFLIVAIKNNVVCISCCQRGKKLSKKHKENISKGLKNSEKFQTTMKSKEYQNKLRLACLNRPSPSKETREKIRRKLTGRKRSVKEKRKLITYIKEHRKGKTNIEIYGKDKAKEISKKVSKANTGKQHPPVTIETREKLRNALLGRTVTEETRNKIRVSRTRYMKLSGQAPSFNINSIKLFEDLNKMIGLTGKHALNGGEETCCGYWLDYYEPINNIVIEFDEQHHNKPCFIKKDIIREKRIVGKLKGRFFRINKKEMCIYEVICKNRVKVYQSLDGSNEGYLKYLLSQFNILSKGIKE